MARRSARWVLAALALVATVSVLYHFQHQSTTPVFFPVQKVIVDKLEADSAGYFTKSSTEDMAHGHRKHVFWNSKHPAQPERDNTLLVVSTVADMKSFGRGRSFSDFMDLIGSFEYDKKATNLAFFCGTDDLFHHVDAYFENFFGPETEYAKVTVLSASFLSSEFAPSDHNTKVQRERRRLIARARNFSLLSSLDTEQYTVFVDADIIKIEHRDMILRFVASEKDIIVPRIIRGSHIDYDKNSWRGERRTPLPIQLKFMDTNQWSKVTFVPKDVKGKMFHLEDYAKSVRGATASDERLDPNVAVELDSVGGAILFVKSIIYKQGVVFPPTYIVGTTWQRQEGYDGIETEGLCYIAKVLGYKCWGMPNLLAHHNDNDWI